MLVLIALTLKEMTAMMARMIRSVDGFSKLVPANPDSIHAIVPKERWRAMTLNLVGFSWDTPASRLGVVIN